MKHRYKLNFKNIKELQSLIDEYFDQCEGKTIVDENGHPIIKNGREVKAGAKPATITGLVIHLGFHSRHDLITYIDNCDNEKIKEAIILAKTRCENYAEQRLYDAHGSRGAQFSLQFNFGWNDNTEKKEVSAVQIIDDIASIMRGAGGNDTTE